MMRGFWRLFKKKKRVYELAPDEIFLDSANLPDFNTDRLEGRLEKPVSHKNFAWLGTVLVVLFFVLVGQAIKLEVVQGDQ